jgi:8-oxo-dGTP pyrophosphatase MutT (NUDIX family)
MADPQHTRAIQRFEVSLKAAIVCDQRLLLLKEADTGYWELPGGRIDVGEERLAHEAILAREIREELGDGIKLLLRQEAASFMRQRPTDGAFLFLMVRLAVFDGGEIRLSDEHSDYRWFGPNDWQRLKFPELSDYAKGLQEVWRMIDGIA